MLERPLSGDKARSLMMLTILRKGTVSGDWRRKKTREEGNEHLLNVCHLIDTKDMLSHLTFITQ